MTRCDDVGGKHAPDRGGRYEIERGDRPDRFVEIRKDLGKRSQSGDALQGALVQLIHVPTLRRTALGSHLSAYPPVGPRYIDNREDGI